MSAMKIRPPVGHDMSAYIHSKAISLAIPTVYSAHADGGEGWQCF